MCFVSMESKQQQKGRGHNKRYWASEEDKILIDALVELSTNPIWRVETAFKVDTSFSWKE